MCRAGENPAHHFGKKDRHAGEEATDQKRTDQSCFIVHAQIVRAILLVLSFKNHFGVHRLTRSKDFHGKDFREESEAGGIPYGVDRRN